MKLENILDEEVNRRRFLRLAIASSIFGCGKKKIIGSGPGKGNDSSNDNGSDESGEDLAGDYTKFSVADYSAQSAIVEEGYTGIRFTNKYGESEIYPVEIDRNGNTETIGSGIVVNLYQNSEEDIVYAYDSRDRYLPGFAVYSNEAGKVAGVRQIAMYLKDTADRALHFGRKVVIREIQEASPDWNEDHVINIPGIKYHGDWSFNQTRNLNTLLNKTSTVFSFTGLGAIISAATIKAESLFAATDEMIDLVNERTPFNIDKDEKFGWYGLSPGALILIPSYLIERYRNRNPGFNILDFFPATVGNSWDYNSSIYGDVNASVTSVRDVNGKKVVVSRSSTGVSSFYGFRDGELKLMGADYWNPDFGEAYFEPGVLLGTDNMDIGDSFKTTSRVRYAEIPEINIRVDELIELQGKEHVSVPAGEFGDCLKVKETVRFYGRDRDRKKIDATDVSYSWSARNIGGVKSRIVGGGLLKPGTSELRSATVNGVGIPKSASGFNEIRPLILDVIEEAYKRFV